MTSRCSEQTSHISFSAQTFSSSRCWSATWRSTLRQAMPSENASSNFFSPPRRYISAATHAVTLSISLRYRGSER